MWKWLVLGLGWLVPLSAQANDSTAALTAGGLVLTKTDAIAMEAERLVITPDSVSVGYRFKNTTNKSVVTQVAFPLPELSLSDAFYGHPVIPSDDPLNFVGFQTQADGNPVDAKAEVRFRVNDHDVTDRFLQLGLVSSLADPKTHKVFETEAARDGLKALGASLEGTPADLKQQTAFHWRQTFPPAKEVAISHRYRPVAGIQNLSPLEWRKLSTTAFKELFCLDDGAARGIEDYLGTKVFYPTRTIRYVLMTGNNWAGGIGRFKLQVRPSGEFEVAVFCKPDGSGGVAGRTLELDFKNFSPERDLYILFIGRRGGY